MTDQERTELDQLRVENERLRNRVVRLQKSAIDCPDCLRILDHLHESHLATKGRRTPTPSDVRLANCALALALAALVLIVLILGNFHLP